MDRIDQILLREIADLEKTPQGAYNIRKNGKLESRSNSANIIIENKEDKPGIDIHVAPGTKNESLHIPVIVTQTGFTDLVYNDFHIGEDADVEIIAGCGIHNSGCETAQHDGIHTFHIGKNARVKYVEKHYGEGDGAGKNVMNRLVPVMHRLGFDEVYDTAFGADLTIKEESEELMRRLENGPLPLFTSCCTTAGPKPSMSIASRLAK